MRSRWRAATARDPETRARLALLLVLAQIAALLGLVLGGLFPVLRLLLQ